MTTTANVAPSTPSAPIPGNARPSADNSRKPTALLGGRKPRCCGRWADSAVRCAWTAPTRESPAPATLIVRSAWTALATVCHAVRAPARPVIPPTACASAGRGTVKCAAPMACARRPVASVRSAIAVPTRDRPARGRPTAPGSVETVSLQNARTPRLTARVAWRPAACRPISKTQNVCGARTSLKTSATRCLPRVNAASISPGPTATWTVSSVRSKRVSYERATAPCRSRRTVREATGTTTSATSTSSRPAACWATWVAIVKPVHPTRATCAASTWRPLAV